MIDLTMNTCLNKLYSSYDCQETDVLLVINGDLSMGHRQCPGGRE